MGAQFTILAAILASAGLAGSGPTVVVVPTGTSAQYLSIVGVGVVGKTLTYELPDDYTGDALVSFQWYMNAGDGTGPVAIAGATGSAYEVQASDADKFPSLRAVDAKGVAIASLEFVEPLSVTLVGDKVVGDYTSGLYQFPVPLGGYPSIQHPSSLYGPALLRDVAGDSSSYQDIIASPGAWEAYSGLYLDSEFKAEGNDWQIMCYWRGAGTQACTAVLANPNPANAVRPAYNTGTGFFVLNGDLYDANGVRFIMDGVNRCHWDSGATGMYNTGMNVCRMFIDFTQTAETNLALMSEQIANKVVPTPCMSAWSGGATSGSVDPTVMAECAQTWATQAATWTTLDQVAIFNVANEWGPSGTDDNTVWRDACIAAIGVIRAAGYKGALMFDAPGSGQDVGDNGAAWTLLNHSAAVFNADPLKNIVFGLHVYGSWSPGQLLPVLRQLRALALSVGMVFAVTEYGPAKVTRSDASQTYVEALEVKGDCYATGLGCIAWAWDDGASDDYDGGFALCKNAGSWVTGTAGFASSAAFPTGNPDELTVFGRQVVRNPAFGTLLAVKATVF